MKVYHPLTMVEGTMDRVEDRVKETWYSYAFLERYSFFLTGFSLFVFLCLFYFLFFFVQSYGDMHHHYQSNRGHVQGRGRGNVVIKIFLFQNLNASMNTSNLFRLPP